MLHVNLSIVRNFRSDISRAQISMLFAYSFIFSGTITKTPVRNIAVLD